MRIRASWLFAACLIALVVVSTSAWEDRAPMVAETLFAIATVLVAIAAVGRLWCSLYIAGYKKRTLIKEGPYSMCRNPLYFFSLIGGVGVGMATETMTIPVIIFVMFVLYYPRVIRKEEKVLRGLHGEEYDRYTLSVPRFFPRIDLTEPHSYVVNPVVFRRHIFSAIWFVWILGIAEVVEALHEGHYIPALFSIY